LIITLLIGYCSFPQVHNTYNASQQPSYQSYQQQPRSQSFQSPQSFQQPQPPYSQASPQGTGQYTHNTQPQYGGGQPVVNLPRTNDQYGTTPQQTYASQRAPPYGASGYSGPPNDNSSQQSYYKGNNDDNIRYDDFYL
jgi:hypothetical protein